VVRASLNVTVRSSIVSLSIVTPKGIPISSVRAYLLPMLEPPSSTLKKSQIFSEKL